MSAVVIDGVQLVDEGCRKKQRIPDRRRAHTACGRSSACGGRSLSVLSAQERIDALSPTVRGPCEHH